MEAAENKGEVTTIMIGIRNPKKRNRNDNDDMLPKSVEVWANELRLCGFDDRQGFAKIRVDKDGGFKYWQEDSPAIVRLKQFVSQVTDRDSKDFVPAVDRIATFDVDGTLLCETAPTYFNFMLFCYRMLDDSTYTPDPDDRAFAEEIKTYVLANHTLKPDWGFRQQEVQAKSFYGMTCDEYDAWIKNYIEHEYVVGLSNLKWGTALYWPMIEVVKSSTWVTPLFSYLPRP